MIEIKDLIPLLVQSYPYLRDRLVQTANQWLGDDGSLRPCMIMSIASDLVTERLDKGEFDGAEQLFKTVERLLREGKQAVQDAAATCFLENLINRSARLDPRLYVWMMGAESRRYCRAWDEFTGSKTPGLYDEESR